MSEILSIFTACGDKENTMNSYDYNDGDLISNPTTRVPVCLCLDTSGSMDGEPIQELNKGMRQFFTELKNDEVARFAAEVCIVTFGDSARCIQDFGPLEQQISRDLSARGDTPMGEALTIALDMLEVRKQKYKDTGVDYFQPWLVVMTDGYPNGDASVLRESVARASQLAATKKLNVIPIIIGNDADETVLRQISNKNPLKLNGLKFVEFFRWLSRSVSKVSSSMPGEEVGQPKLNIDDVRDWGTL